MSPHGSRILTSNGYYSCIISKVTETTSLSLFFLILYHNQETAINSSMLAKPPSTLMTSQDNTQIDLEIQTLLAQLNDWISNLEEKITAAKSFKAEIEALLKEARESHHSSTARTHLDKARELLMQKIDEFKKEEDSGNKGLPKIDATEVPSDLTDMSMVLKDHEKIQILATELDQYIAEVDQKVQVLENPSYLREEIEKLNVYRLKAESLKLFLQSSERRKDLEVTQRIAYVNQWLNHKNESLRCGESASEGYSSKYTVLVVSDSCDDRETLQKLFMSIKSEYMSPMDVQVAKNGKEAVYLHLAGARFDMIVMADSMPIMSGFEATKQLKDIGINSCIVGVTDSSTGLRAFIEAGIDNCMVKPLTRENITDLFPDLSDLYIAI